MKTTTRIVSILMASAILTLHSGFTHVPSGNPATLKNAPNKEIVKAYYIAFEKKDWSMMEQILAEGFTFSSPLDDHINLKLFKERCWPNAEKIKRCDLEKLTVNGDEAFVVYNGWTTEGKLFRNCDFFKLKDGKIIAYECFFGPGVNYPNSGK
jgi:ketosteroid isomerase-like protein